jgi:hypothetical protein
METTCGAFLSQSSTAAAAKAMKILQNRFRKQQQKERVKVGLE